MNHISINDKYYISFHDLKMSDSLKEKEHYLDHPKAFLQRFTDLSKEHIEEILKDKELTMNIVNTIYDKLDVTQEQTFISKVNKAYSTFNKIDMLFFMALHYSFKIPMTELLNKTTQELLILFLINTQIHRDDNTVVENVCENLKNYYSEKTVEDFKKLCIIEKTKEEQMKEWNDEFSQFSQL